ncbi:SDR family NAD(P)-dependent oxidoreductase [Mycobacterium sp. URHB0044]|jgi:NAD(P)-dependent dehydrogenase (short-subunit alcohol dehydrogenase family)|uniref:SDR family NAD(P)-dependent oxidoreductase n=1 Tax=Mycobacterium sp. URHB0044 TaxID=1380386 RepID=UPI00048DA9E3|nr:SDR family NAD(P)-dependent oxidoreductase [Mycobacterium sp. URHB0044]
MNDKWTEQNVPNQRDRIAVVTGANTGLGYRAAQVLAEKGASVVLAVRDIAKGKDAAARIAQTAPRADLTVLHLDLTSLASVHDATAELHQQCSKIDLLINNAGVMIPPRQSTSDGFESQFGINHLGHFALTGLLLDLLLPVADSRIVTVSSLAHSMKPGINFDDLQWERSYSRSGAYAQSKLANLMFTYELQRRLASHGTTVAVAAHPGIADTELSRHMPAYARPLLPIMSAFVTQNSAMGTLSILRAATDPAVLGGQYYGPDGRGERKGYPQAATSSSRSYDLGTQRRLWTVSEQLTGVTFPV